MYQSQPSNFVRPQSNFLRSQSNLQKVIDLNYLQFALPQYLESFLILSSLINHLIKSHLVKSLGFHHQLKSLQPLSILITCCFQFHLLTALLHPLHFALTLQSLIYQTHQVLQEARLPYIISDHNFQHLRYLSCNKTANVLASTNQTLCKHHHHKQNLLSLSFLESKRQFSLQPNLLLLSPLQNLFHPMPHSSLQHSGLHSSLEAYLSSNQLYSSLPILLILTSSLQNSGYLSSLSYFHPIAKFHSRSGLFLSQACLLCQH